MLDRCHVVVLAAGRGSRMGGPKAIMEIGGEPWWRHQATRLAEMRINATWVVSDTVRDAMRHHQNTPGRVVVADSTSPMFASLLAGWRSLPPDLHAVFVLPIDTPVAAEQTWHALAASGAHVTIPTFHGKGGHPVYLPFAWVQSTLYDIDQNGRSASNIRLDELIAPVARQLPVDDPLVAMNLNTKEDVQAMLSASSKP